MEIENKYETLKKQYDALENQYGALDDKIEKLKDEHEILQKEYNSLQTNYSENIIIQSMQEMKERYDKMLKSTVTIHKYDTLYEKYKKLVKNFSGCTIILEYVIKTLKQLNRTLFTESKNLLFKAELQLEMIKEILEDSITC
jgi:hypothetical protein